MAYEFNFDNGTFIDVDPVGSGMGSAVVPLILRRQDGGTPTVHNQGTAFCIGASAAGQLLLVTARHVVADLEDEGAGLEPMVVLPSADDPEHLVGLFVRQMSIAPAFQQVFVDRDLPREERIEKAVRSYELAESRGWGHVGDTIARHGVLPPRFFADPRAYARELSATAGVALPLTV